MSTKKSSQKKVAQAKAVEQPIKEQSVIEPSVTEKPSQPSPQSQIEEINLAEIVPNPLNPRKYFDDESLSELAQNILEHGVLQPVTVREIPESGGRKYEIVFGERRLRAAKTAGLKTIPCMVRNLNDDAAFDLMVSENLSRENILPSEEAAAFKSILERGNSIAYISERFGKSETFVHSRLVLVRLIPEVTELLDNGEISIGMAVEIARLEPEIQENLLTEHLNTDIAFNCWKNLPLKVFGEKLETAYTVQLSRFSFDKTECETCMFNSELHSLFPDLDNSRCTRTTCLVKKQEQHMLDSILASVGEENLDVYIKSGSSGAIHTDVVKKLNELGIKVKSGNVYPVPENPVMPSEENFADDRTRYEQAQKDFQTKQTKWNALQELIGNGLARKVVMIDNLSPDFGYIMLTQETAKTGSEASNGSSVPGNPAVSTTPNSPITPQTPNDAQSAPSASIENTYTTIKSDLMSTLQEKDRKNREEALGKVIDDARA